MKNCINCKEEINWNNVATDSGKKEVDISGLCEKCFDNISFNLYDNLHHLDSEVLQMVNNIECLVLAGGSLRKLVDRNDIIMDYDLFFLDTPEKESVKNNLVQGLKNSEEYKKVFECPEGKLFTFIRKDKVKLQIIDKRSYEDCNDLISSFDITASSACWNGVAFYKDERFVFDVLNKRLNINTVEYPVATLKRLMKYQDKGYKLTNQASKRFVMEVSETSWSDQDLEFYID